MPYLERDVLLVSLCELRPGQRLHVVFHLSGSNGARARGGWGTCLQDPKSEVYGNTGRVTSEFKARIRRERAQKTNEVFTDGVGTKEKLKRMGLIT